ncbi:glutathione S-transferase family protein [Croceicoccus ponticola]|uniref:Glutathione S-transferase family protein n=1 Tax=Croceicoccus ponticola TaxID=2217664 RepID=A0A437GTZ5_9SPHN|nr:glutathione S-transferase family protein [Croceicoccus ponticola]RVQ64598.1 glutathione S-transferase family protein [Croceicoccus ponticola]
MIFYDFDLFAPSPWVVWMFAQEKGIKFERKVIDLLARENRRAPFITDVNPLGELPAIVLDDGTALTEITAICEYLEDIQPDPPLIGSTPLERVETRMWVRRIDQKIAEPLGEGFSTEEGREFFESDKANGLQVTKTVLPAEAAPVLKAKAREKIVWISDFLKGRQWVCGDRFSLADIFLYCYLQFGEHHGQPIPEEAGWARDFFDRMKSRPTAWQGEAGSLD